MCVNCTHNQAQKLAELYDKALSTFLSKQPGKAAKLKAIEKLVGEKQFDGIRYILAENAKRSRDQLKI